MAQDSHPDGVWSTLQFDTEFSKRKQILFWISKCNCGNEGAQACSDRPSVAVTAGLAVSNNRDWRDFVSGQ